MILAVIVGIVLATAPVSFAEEAPPDAMVETTGGDAGSAEAVTTPPEPEPTTVAPEPAPAASTDTAPTESAPAASTDTAPTEAAPSDATVPASEPDLRPTGDIGVQAAADPVPTAEVAPVVTPLAGSHVNKCQGALPTPGSGNTRKRLIGGTLVPGGTATFEIEYPFDEDDLFKTFTILDCVFIGGVETQAYEITIVPNNRLYVFSFTLTIPADAVVGAEYCNVAKTTGPPDDPQASNRKAGPACFLIGGDIQVLKVDVSGASLNGATFSVTCVPPTVAPGTFLPPIIIEGVARNTYTGVIDDGLITIAGPQGTVCTITETIPPPGYELAIPATQTATIGLTQVTLTFVNERSVGDLRINKTTTGGTGTFTFAVDCSVNTFDQTVTIVNSGSQTITGIPTGTTCTVTETSNPLFTSTVTTGSSPVTIGTGTNTIGFTNVRNTGSLVINKTTTGGTGTFTFAVDCSDNAFDQTVTIVNSGSETIAGIPTGTTCTVTEANNPSFTSTIISGASPVTIGTGLNAIGFLNVRLTGSLVINKTTTGGTGTFTFAVDCSDNAFDQTVTIVNSGSQTIAGIPTGTTCTVTEANNPLFTSTIISGASPVTIGTGLNPIGFLNVRNTGSLVINKTTIGGGGTFTFTVDCSDNAFDQVVTIVDSGTRTISGIPTGTTCTVVETANPLFASTVTTGASPITIGAGLNTIGFTNRLLLPTLGVVKVADAATVNAGSPIGFGITVSNSGPGPAYGVTLSDPLPSGAGLTWSISPAYSGPGTCSISGSPGQTLNCSFGDLAPGASVNVHVVSPTTGATSGTFLNVATASATNHPPVTDRAQVVVIKPNLTIVKTADDTSVNSGSQIGFTVTVANAGPGTATAVVLNDPLPPAAGVTWSISPSTTGCSISGSAPTQVLNCTFGDLASGASVSVHVVSNTTFATSGTLLNTATVSAGNHPPVVDDAQVVINRPGLSVTKLADAPSVSSGSPIGFTVTVSNAGPGTAINVVLNDPLPSGTGINWSISPTREGCSITGAVGSQVLSCSFGDMATGASASVHVTSATTAATSGTFTNSATASADNHPPVTGIANVIVNKPNLSVTKTADAASVSSGSPIGFTVTVANAGPGTATGVTLSDPLPAATGVSWSISPAQAGCAITGTAPTQTLNCTFGDLASGASASVHVISATTAATTGTLTNTATAQATNHPPVTGVASVVVNKPNLSVTKTADAASVIAGNPIGFTVTVSNAGPGAATNLTVSDPLPGGTGIDWSISPATAGCSITGAAPTQTLTCTVASLASGASLVVHVVSQTTAASVGTFENVATAKADNHPEVKANATTSVVAAPIVLGTIIERAAPAIIEPAPAPPPPPAPAPAAVAAATLPRTGTDPLTLVFSGLLLIAAGLGFRRWGRRA